MVNSVVKVVEILALDTSERQFSVQFWGGAWRIRTANPLPASQWQMISADGPEYKITRPTRVQRGPTRPARL